MAAGRKKLPTALKALKGTDQKCRRNPGEPKPAAPVSLAPPKWLGDIAKKEWKKKAPILARMGVFTECDDSALAAYCQAYEQVVLATEDVKLNGQQRTNDKGNQVKNPAVEIANRGMEIMNRFASEFGLTPSSRSKIVVKPEKAAPAEWEGFEARTDEPGRDAIRPH